ncbi:hypothetical protein [Kitasatospora kifunensis]|uniref:Biotin carboxylase n=1 Tax=Kitasatospora kifunensis TaxID=58351 RepID=A0A7W7VSV7_KITKI|nr:hypothetical protein [Kitasatospora kifunensis]MBB4921044.1 biotin carboxylase [Kitasatospora kifunensis]
MTVLYENTRQNQRRLTHYRDRVEHACAVDSYQNVEALWSAVHHTGAVREGVDAVVPVLETGVVPAAVLGRLLGARALAPQVALRCRDKAVQKACWDAAGVPTARHLVVPDATAVPGALAALTERAGLRAPFVVKPTAGYGTVNTFVVDRAVDLEPAVAAVTALHPELARLLIEERNSGDEWVLDGLVRDGVISWIMVSRFLIPLVECDEHRPFMKLSLPPAGYPDLYESATAFARRALDALELRDGVFHFELFGDPDRWVAGELAARPGGQLVAALLAEMLGVDVWECAVKAVTGDAMTPPRGPSKNVLGYIALPIAPGRTNHVAAADLAALPGVVALDMTVAPGELMPDTRENSSARIGGLIIEAADQQECARVLARAEQIVARLNGARSPRRN